MRADDVGLLRRLIGPVRDEAALADAVVIGRLGGLWERATTARVLGLLAYALMTDESTSAAMDRGARRALEVTLRVNHQRVVVARRFGAKVLGALGAAGVPAAVVHGLAAASVLYGDGARDLGGIDILVSPDNFVTARGVLRELDYTAVGRTRWRQRIAGDPLVDDIVIHLVARRYLDSATVSELLGTRVDQVVPGCAEALTVLAEPAAHLLDLALVGGGGGIGGVPRTWQIDGDLLRRYPRLAQHPGPPAPTPAALVEPVAAGWDLLLRSWPDHLPATATEAADSPTIGSGRAGLDTRP